MPSTIPKQSKALIRRYQAHIIRKPISNAIRGLLLPVSLIGMAAHFLPRIVNNMTDVKPEIDLVNYISTFIFVAMAFQFYHFSQWLVNDKATGVKSLMLSMGLKRTSYYLGNSICFLAYSIPVVMTICALSLAYLMTKSQKPTVAIIMVFFLATIHLTAQLFVFASFITSSSYVMLVTYLWILETQSHSLIVWIMGQSSVALQPIVLFFGSMSPLESIRILCNSYSLCKNCDKTQLSNGMVSQPTYLILIAMAFWSGVAFAFARWFEEVCPWQKDSAIKSPLFCLPGNKVKLTSIIDENTIIDSKYFEQTTAHQMVGIQISNLSKIFKQVPVVNNINFQVHKGETTLLLGHNGAGKTTLMEMILGKLDPSSGQVTLTDSNGHLSNGKECVGVCPQASILDDNLSVRQHLELFADIKTSQMSPTELDKHIKTTIADVSLTNHINKLPTELSGGMKRKLSLALAFVGNSRILILDEPSSGLDPDSRVFVWNAIRRYRTERTVLLSTQHMEEADYLGDRIAIMSKGKIICCGSSTFLNKVLGSGYRLRVECQQSKSEQVLSFVKKYFEAAKPSDSIQMVSPMATQANSDPIQDFVIELSGNNSEDLEMSLIKMLEEIEKNSSKLYIKSHGLKSSSIEDVLLNTSKLSQESHDATAEKMEIDIETKADLITKLAEPLRAPYLSFLANQSSFVRALLLKHIHSYRKEWKSINFYRVLVPTLCVYAILIELKRSSLSVGLFSSSILPSILVSHYVYNPVRERTSKFKTMQLTSNANFVIYWLSQLLIDSLSFIILAIDINLFWNITFSGIFSVSAGTHIVATLAIFMMGISAALLAYIFSFMLNDIKTCCGYYLILGATSSMATWLIYLISVLTSSDLKWLVDILTTISTAVSPMDSFQYILFGLSEGDYNGQAASRYFSPISYGFVALSGQIIVYGLLLYLIEKLNLDVTWYLRWKNIFGTKKASSAGGMSELDSDVVNEISKAKKLVNSFINRQTFSLVASDLSKSYVAGEAVVNGLSFSVNRGECFGLLGVNGAGKSTTFSMLVDEIKPDTGKIWANGYFNDYDVTQYRQSIGYDPQSNPAMSLSPVDALYLMARLRCVHEDSIPKMVNSILELLAMTEHAAKPASILSGGTKRKLALGMSLIGNPALLALDEPTAGVDPFARRRIWQLLRSLRAQNGSSIVISSHAMEECEAICDRISIMARGRLRCVGTFMSLRSRFSQGCRIRVQFGGQLIEQNGIDGMKKLICTISERLQAELGGSVRLTDTNATSATYNVSDDNVERSKIFRMLRELRQTHPGMCYMVDDSSLEDIFIALAREQQEIGPVHTVNVA